MKVKTFISQSSHNNFDELISKLLSETQGEQMQDELINELATRKQELARIFDQYKEKFDEIHQLIVIYQAEQLEIRKKIRRLQLQQKGGGLRMFTRKVIFRNALPQIAFLLANSPLIDVLDIFDLL